jgi:signal transduction histidine kinase
MQLLMLICLLVLTGVAVALLLQRRSRARDPRAVPLPPAQQAHAARLAAVGELSASIAHEIAQPLAAILSNAEAGEKLIESGRGNMEEIREILAAIRQDDERASAVIQRLRDLLRRAPVEMRPLDLNDTIAQAVRLVEGNASQRGVRIRASLGAGLPQVRGDAVQLQQVMLNLVMNGVDAAAASATQRRAVVVESSGGGEGAVEICVRDSGAGIEPSDMQRIFEPFFSTKPDGMGLGLSISRSIVSAHGGTLRAESSPAGTVFRLALPTCREPLPQRQPRYTSDPPGHPS